MSVHWAAGLLLLTAGLGVAVAAPAVGPAPAYVPLPRVADTGRYLVGAFMCPLWNNRAWEQSGGRDCWGPIVPFPERQPLLGWYDEGTPAVTDWEVLWALEHGISFMVPCWYRAKGNLGKPVELVLGHWLHEGLFKGRYGEQMKFALLWENGNPIACGVNSAQDLLENVLPFWIEHYFRRPNYLTLDGRPVLFIYRLDVLVAELGGVEAARAALAALRTACVAAGFPGLVVVGEHHLRLDRPVPLPQALGADYASSYHWPSFAGLLPADPVPAALIAAQEQCWSGLGSATGLPALVTVSMGWDDRPWNPGAGPGWRLEPAEFATLCARAKAFVDRQPGTGAEQRLVLLDNWNEFGEGHFIFPHRRAGFGYLDAVRATFAESAGAHTDIVPEDLGLGPYDGLYQAAVRQRAALGGWESPLAATTLALQAHALVLTTVGDDPQIITTAVPAVSGPLRVSLRLRCASRGPGQVFWTTQAEPRFQAGQAVGFALPHDGEWHEVAVAFAPAAPLLGLRLDPGTAPGTVEIAWIRLQDGAGTTLREWRFGAEPAAAK